MADFWKNLAEKARPLWRLLAKAVVRKYREDQASAAGSERSVPRPAPKPGPPAATSKTGAAGSRPAGSPRATTRATSKTTGKPGTAAPKPGPRPGTQPGRVPAQVARNSQVAALQRRKLAYAPEPDGEADPGEIVWTWVPYEDDPSQGKDRPVLVVGRDGGTVFGLMLSSQDSRDGQRHWHPLGPGNWDRDNRPSWVRLDRVLTVAEDGIRREGAVLDRTRFDRVAAALRTDYGWH
ncbi:type II toxin-antitoxin system PemK/MazF family toxin [Melissospora conviva]|uniref:type II toxin-antitoxin system PemK/MazF family toxin n=1 Tax=Melissospora conviva TaxID=3388432 RepID=UPI003B77AFCC